MSKWKKLLARMLSDVSPMGYSYDDASTILAHLGFQLAPSGGGSHRKWRFKTKNGNTVVIGLVEKGSGNLKPYLVRDMLAQLKANALVPEDIDE